MYTFKSFFKFELSAFLGLLALAALLGFAASMCVLFSDNGGYSGATIGIIKIIALIVLIVVPYCAPFVVLAGIPAYFLFPRPKVIHLRSWWAMLTALIGMGTALLCFLSIPL